MLHDFQAFGEQLGVSVVELDVVTRCGSGFQSQRFADHEGHRFRLGLAHGFGGQGATFALVQHLVRQLMH